MKIVVDIKKRFTDFNFDVCFQSTTNRLALLGTSGSGKSMTLKAIAGLITPDEGLIQINDRVLFDSDRKINVPAQERRVGYLFQNYALYPHLTVEKNLTIALRNASDRSTITKTLQMLHVEDLVDRYPKELSGGEQQRVAIARMLVNQPSIALLDEPLSALDYSMKWRLEEELLRLFDEVEIPMIFVSHDRQEVYRMSREVVVIGNGQVDSQGTTREVFETPTTLYTSKLVGVENHASVRCSSQNTFLIDAWGIDTGIPYVKGYSTIGLSSRKIGLFPRKTPGNLRIIQSIKEIESETYLVQEQDTQSQWMIRKKEGDSLTVGDYVDFDLSKCEFLLLKDKEIV